ncbi:hypothetical protein GCM10008106_01480 [Mongoliitalea lutea]|uniref:Uncharacterized protein n=1 Tax=Mongoliitalea lutea TaxID=849756 RepID=A0A8J3CVR3_9BACT|nr:hypothetical protein GCM10008106_01480 [Mongoliitalea lutea]
MQMLLPGVFIMKEIHDNRFDGKMKSAKITKSFAILNFCQLKIIDKKMEYHTLIRVFFIHFQGFRTVNGSRISRGLNRLGAD